MKKLLRSRDGASKGAALIIVLAFVVIVTALALRISPALPPTGSLPNRATTIHRRICSLGARSTSPSAILSRKLRLTRTVTAPIFSQQRYRAMIPTDNPNLIRRSVRDDNDAPRSPGPSTVSSSCASANGRSISVARWNSHYLIPPDRDWHRFHTCRQFHRTGLGAGNSSGTESRTSAKCGDRKVCLRRL